MFNSKYKKEAIARYEETIEEFEEVKKIVVKNSTKLYKARTDSVKTLEDIESLVNKIANTPKEFDKELKRIKVNVSKFTNILKDIDTDNPEKVGGSLAGAGIATGAGVAAFAPTVAMGIATTFGTAATGTAISTLSGAAATNAALAWLGGGALVAGGGGMAGGSALLALAGPLGWGIGAIGVVGGGLLASNKNKKIAEQAIEANEELMEAMAGLHVINEEIVEITKLTKKHTTKIKKQNELLSNELTTYNYLELSQEQRKELGAMVNNATSLSKLLNRTVGEK